MIRFLPADAARVLDVGCGGGIFAAGLKDRFGVEVWGIEIDPDACAAAAPRLDVLLGGDAVARASELPSAHFDCIFLNDILEHLVEPEELLRLLAGKIAPGGRLVASLPNVRHFPVLWDLAVRGRWEYVDEGILDRTHLRFYTKSSIEGMFARCGYGIERLVGINPTGSLHFRLFNLLTLGRFAETRFLQYACVAQVAPTPSEIDVQPER